MIKGKEESFAEHCCGCNARDRSLDMHSIPWLIFKKCHFDMRMKPCGYVIGDVPLWQRGRKSCRVWTVYSAAHGLSTIISWRNGRWWRERREAGCRGGGEGFRGQRRTSRKQSVESCACDLKKGAVVVFV